jgi:hypothetical protein
MSLSVFFCCCCLGGFGTFLQFGTRNSCAGLFLKSPFRCDLVSSARSQIQWRWRLPSTRYIRRIDRALASFAGPMGSQRYCVAPGRLAPKGPERSCDADSREAHMTSMGFRKLFDERKVLRKPLSLAWRKLFKACSVTMWIEALLFMLSSMDCTSMPSWVQYRCMLLWSCLIALDLLGLVVEVASQLPKPKKPTDAWGRERSLDASRELLEVDDASCRSGRETLTMVPHP